MVEGVCKSGLVKHRFKAIVLEAALQGTAKSKCVKKEESLRMSEGWEWVDKISWWIEAAVAGSGCGFGEVGFGV